MAASRSSYTCAFATADADGVAQAQAVGGAGSLTLNGAFVSGGVAQVATSPAERQIGITSAADDTGIVFTVAGANASGAAISETVTGANAGVAVTSQGFTTVTSVTASGAAAGNVSVGTTAVANTPWIVTDTFVEDFQASFMVEVVSGSPTYSVQVTYDELMQVGAPAPVAFDVTGLTGETTNQNGAVTEPVSGIRAQLTTGTGTIRLLVLQGGIGG